MLFRKLLILSVLVCGVSPALAGEATYQDMRGKWQSTQCTPPQTAAPASPTSEAAANDLNAQAATHNQFVAEARAYMACLSQEAEKDAHAVSYLVTESANMLIKQTQQQINDSSFQIKAKKED